MSNYGITPSNDKNGERYLHIQRIEKYIQIIKSKYLYSAALENTDFLFRDGQYSPDDINEGEWTFFDGNTEYWGYPECYCWFKQTIVVPTDFDRKNLWFSVMPHDGAWDEKNPQLILFMNGHAVCGMDSNHQSVKLCDRAKAGDTLEIAINAYADPHEYRGKLRMRSKIYSRNDIVYTLVCHMQTALQYAELLDIDNMARVNIVSALNEACNILRVDLDTFEQFKPSCVKAAEFIEKNIYGHTDGPLVSVIGHTHIDVAYLWRLRQTREKAARSFASMLNLMDEYPDFRFISSQPQLYEFVKEDYPEIYEKIKTRVADGRWETEGGMWVEADTNIPSGESLIRQFLFGKAFFKKEFEKDNKILWLPDVFGYSAALPQIIKKCGLKYFMTTKISWNEYTKFPYDTFMWKGIDGTSILSHLIPTQHADDDENGEFRTTYNGDLCPDEVLGAWKRYQQKDINQNILFAAGHGDGGGGTTREMIEHTIRMKAGLEGCPQTEFETAGQFFRRLETETKDKTLSTWQGELYLENHRGTLTSQARNKRFNRKAEILYHDIENIESMAAALCGEYKDYPEAELQKSWKTILLNQFHDIIPGSAIKAVYDDSKLQYDEVFADGQKLLDGAIDKIISKLSPCGKTLVVFNTLSGERSDCVYFDYADDKIHLEDESGFEYPVQKCYDGKLCFFAKNLPSKGFKTYKIIAGPVNGKNNIIIDANHISTPFFEVEYDGHMQIGSIIHKGTKRRINPDKAVFGELIAYDDTPLRHDAWNLEAHYTEKYWPVDSVSSADVVEQGPVRTVIGLKRKFRKSDITQYIIYYNELERIDVVNEIDWHENNICLRVLFPADVNADKATFDIQFGNIERPTHSNTLNDFARFECSAQKWADIGDRGFGVSVINDCKYGYSAKDNVIGLSLIRCQNYPQHPSDNEMHYFTYSVYPHGDTWDRAKTSELAYSLNYPVLSRVASGDGEKSAQDFSLAHIDESNIIIETIKKGENDDCIILRAYESQNKSTDTLLHFGCEVFGVFECDMLENEEYRIKLLDGSVKLCFKPFEIKTIKVKIKNENSDM